MLCLSNFSELLKTRLTYHDLLKHKHSILMLWKITEQKKKNFFPESCHKNNYSDTNPGNQNMIQLLLD